MNNWMRWSRAFHGAVASRQILVVFHEVVDVSALPAFTPVANETNFVRFHCSHFAGTTREIVAFDVGL